MVVSVSSIEKFSRNVELTFLPFTEHISLSIMETDCSSLATYLVIRLFGSLSLCLSRSSYGSVFKKRPFFLKGIKDPWTCKRITNLIRFYRSYPWIYIFTEIVEFEESIVRFLKRNLSTLHVLRGCQTVTISSALSEESLKSELFYLVCEALVTGTRWRCEAIGVRPSSWAGTNEKDTLKGRTSVYHVLSYVLRLDG